MFFCPLIRLSVSVSVVAGDNSDLEAVILRSVFGDKESRYSVGILHFVQNDRPVNNHQVVALDNWLAYGKIPPTPASER